MEKMFLKRWTGVWEALLSFYYQYDWELQDEGQSEERERERQLAQLYKRTSEKGFWKVYNRDQKVIFYFHHFSLVSLSVFIVYLPHPLFTETHTHHFFKACWILSRASSSGSLSVRFHHGGEILPDTSKCYRCSEKKRWSKVRHSRKAEEEMDLGWSLMDRCTFPGRRSTWGPMCVPVVF